MTRFNPFVTQAYIIITKTFSPNFDNISHRLIDIFGKKSAIRSEVHIFGMWGLNSYGPILTTLRLEMTYLKETYLCNVLSEYIDSCLICILESETIRWNVKLCYMVNKRGFNPISPILTMLKRNVKIVSTHTKFGAYRSSKSWDMGFHKNMSGATPSFQF